MRFALAKVLTEFIQVATYGEGEPTSNALDFVDWLREATTDGSTSLENLHYAVFALGNRTYEHFCEAGREIDAKLGALGATAIAPRGEGDADSNIEEDYLAWKSSFLESIKRQMGFMERHGVIEPDFEIKELGSATVDMSTVYLGELSRNALLNSRRATATTRDPFPALLTSSRELFLAGDRSCVFAEFDIANTGLRYQAGGHLGVYPMNPDCEVNRILKVLGLTAKSDCVIDVISLDPSLAPVPFPNPTTITTVFRHYLDISAAVSRETCSKLRHLAQPGSTAAQRLLEWSSDRELFHRSIGGRGLTLAKLLLHANDEDYEADPSSDLSKVTPWRIDLSSLISLIPRLQPRFYSISSSPKLDKDRVQITAVVLKYSPPAVTEEIRYGLASNYLLGLQLAHSAERQRTQPPRGMSKMEPRNGKLPRYDLAGPRSRYLENGSYRVPIVLRESTFRLPSSRRSPVIMIGPGTGVAPFRGFIRDLVATARDLKSRLGDDALKDWGDIILFYGCRSSDVDHLYAEEWAEYAKELDDKFKMFVAYSRRHKQPKVYVQHLLAQNSDLVRHSIVAKKGYVYICGDAHTMAKDVEAALNKLGSSLGGSSSSFVQRLKKEGRLHLDVW